eukprot:349704-Chlamydomonas_euryale.AAC.4
MEAFLADKIKCRDTSIHKACRILIPRRGPGRHAPGAMGDAKAGLSLASPTSVPGVRVPSP